MTTTQTIDFASEPDYHAETWIEWRSSQWGECKCHLVEGYSPFADCLDGCPHQLWEAAYRAEKAKEQTRESLGDLKSYLTPLTEVNDLSVPEAAYLRNDGLPCCQKGSYRPFTVCRPSASHS